MAQLDSAPTTQPAQTSASSAIQEQQRQFLTVVAKSFVENPQAALESIKQLSPQQRRELMGIFRELHGKGMIAHYQAKAGETLSVDDKKFLGELAATLYGNKVVEGSRILAKAIEVDLAAGPEKGAREVLNALRELGKRGGEIEQVKALLGEQIGQPDAVDQVLKDLGLDDRKVVTILEQGKRQASFGAVAGQETATEALPVSNGANGNGQARSESPRVELVRRLSQSHPKDGVDGLAPDGRPIYHPDKLKDIHRAELDALKEKQRGPRDAAKRAADEECKRYDKENVKLGNLLEKRHKEAKDAIRAKHFEKLDSEVSSLEQKQRAETADNDRLRKENGLPSAAELQAERDREIRREAGEAAGDIAEQFDPTGAVGILRRIKRRN